MPKKIHLTHVDRETIRKQCQKQHRDNPTPFAPALAKKAAALDHGHGACCCCQQCLDKTKEFYFGLKNEN